MNANSLVGVTHRQAADILMHCPDRVCLLTYRPADPQWNLSMGPEAPPPPPTSPLPPDTPTKVEGDTGEVKPRLPPPELASLPPLQPILEAEAVNVEFLPEATPPQMSPITSGALFGDDRSPVPIITLEDHWDTTPPTTTHKDRPRPLSGPMGDLIVAEDPYSLSTISEPNLLGEEGEGEEEEGLKAKSEPHLHDEGERGRVEMETELITLRKWMRGFGFKIDKSLSGQKGVFQLHSLIPVAKVS